MKFSAFKKTASLFAYENRVFQCWHDVCFIEDVNSTNKVIGMKKNAVVIDPIDCVATALQSLKAGDKAAMFIGNETLEVTLRDEIPHGHKFAIKDVPAMGEVYKYGESIGRATQEIKVGNYVHVHNVESERGRGDWK
jgi:altronate dehydratase small subunit